MERASVWVIGWWRGLCPLGWHRSDEGGAVDDNDEPAAPNRYASSIVEPRVAATIPLRARSLAFETPVLEADGSVVAMLSGQGSVLVETLAEDVDLELVALPAGSFWMGSPPGEGYQDERPRHLVAVGPFALGRVPVTQAQWRALVGEPRSRFKGDRLPVENVSWEAAGELCRRLSACTGRPYRLPTEAEWEYAARAGTTTPFAFGRTLTSDWANYCGEHTYAREPGGLYRHTTTDVGRFAPNAFGLHDVHGNVWEWCADAWHDSYADAPEHARAWDESADPAFGVVRGGSWHDPPNLCRSAARLRARRREGDDWIGLRVACDLP
jgi:formylglycine-generating enzyme required for sulfatase activity